MTSRQLRRERRETERKARKAEYQAAKAQAGIDAQSEAHDAPQPAIANRSRAEINRANSLHSTGPRSASGKTRSSQNSFKHGLYSTQLVMPGEDPAELDALKADLIAEHQPVNQSEHILVNEIAEHFWRIRRMRQLEARAFTPENLDGWMESGLLALIQRTMVSAERGLHKALNALLQQRKQRASAQPSTNAEQTTDSGFVPSKRAEAEDDSGFVPEFLIDPSPLNPDFEDDEADLSPLLPERHENWPEEELTAA